MHETWGEVVSSYLDWKREDYKQDDVGMPFYSESELQQAFNAGLALGERKGMKRAMDIVVKPIILTAGNEYKNLILANAAEAIRKEIK